jgi:hypothetical protein
VGYSTVKNRRIPKDRIAATIERCVSSRNATRNSQPNRQSASHAILIRQAVRIGMPTILDNYPLGRDCQQNGRFRSVVPYASSPNAPSRKLRDSNSPPCHTTPPSGESAEQQRYFWSNRLYQPVMLHHVDLTLWEKMIYLTKVTKSQSILPYRIWSAELITMKLLEKN